jgi:methionyl-tRNA formyltransferase
MRIVFAGTPEFAAVALAALIDAAPAEGWTIPLVLTQPDRPSGRGLRATPSPVKQLALAHDIAVDSPPSLRKGEAAALARERLQAAAPDVLVVAAYGLILPADVLAIPRGLRTDWAPALTAINIHASLLPRWRGAAPVVRAIEAGDAVTGVTLMQMDAGLDTGPMLRSQTVAIEPFDTAGSLTARLAALGARLLVEALRDVENLEAVPQPAHATYASKVDKAEAWLDWASAADALERKLRAFDPFPVAASVMRGTSLRLWRGQVLPGAPSDAPPGTVVDVSAHGITVACGMGSLCLTEVQRAGGKRLAARDLVHGFPIAPGDRFDPPPPT